MKCTWRILAVGAFLLWSGCATKQTSNSRPEDLAPVGSVKEVESYRVSDPDPARPAVVDQELESIPTEINPLVEQWIRYFQGRGRPHMERYLARSTRYMSLMKRILRENGLPEDLIYIALIESGFSSRATSRAAAVGYWQFIKGTGKRYGLEINGLVDERRDPVLATQAAAEYFKSLYSVFGSWYLAMASYNVGENRVKREVMKHYTRDFWELARKRRFPKETIHYVPKFIAAKIIGHNPEKYGFTDIDYEKPIEFDLIKVAQPVNLRILAMKMNLEYDEFKQINPKFKGEIAPTKANGLLEIRVPAGQVALASNVVKECYVDRVELIADAGDTTTYKIRPGDSLYTIARKHKTTVSVLRDINDLKPGRKLRVGMRIQVPERVSKKPKPVVVAKKEAQSEDKEKATTNAEIVKNGVVFYVVQPGDTLSAIADDYDSSVNELRKMNRLGRGSVLKVGMRLRVPKDEGLPTDPSENRGGQVASNSSAKTEAVEESPKHTVRAGENLTLIAKKYGVSIDALRKANKLGSRTVLRAGLKLVIPSDLDNKEGSQIEGGARRPASQSRQQVALNSKHKKKVTKRVHVVRKGENLTQIAARYGVTPQEITKSNRLSSHSKILAGAKLLIPAAEAAQ